MHDFHTFEVAVAVLGGLLVVGALLSGVAKRSFLSLTALFVVAGFALGEGGARACSSSMPESDFVRSLAVVALILILFRDGLEVEAELLQEDWHLPLRKLVFAMPITAALVAVATHALTDLDWTESFLLGALLSPTDPVLSSAVVTNPRVPRRDTPFAQPRVRPERRPGAAGCARAPVLARPGRGATSRGGRSSCRTSGSGSPPAPSSASRRRG